MLSGQVQRHTAIVVFAYRRPRHLEQALQALSTNSEAKTLPLVLIVDGPKQSSDCLGIQLCLRVASRFSQCFQSLEVVARPVNLGLYESLTSGITGLFEKYEQLIVVEDDLVVSQGFLAYMLKGLDIYNGNPHVASVHGYALPFKGVEAPETFFLRGADCWGWATWREKWALFRHDAAAMHQELYERNLISEFDLDGAYPYSDLLYQRGYGQSKSWAICWHASCFLADQLSLHPAKSLVKNIGLDSSGEHCGDLKHMTTEIDAQVVNLGKQTVEESCVMRQLYAQYYRKHYSSDSGGLLARLRALKGRAVSKMLRYLNSSHPNHLNLQGPETSYASARDHSEGYDSSLVLLKVKEAIESVLDGDAVYEPDGTAFEQSPVGLKITELLSRYLLDGMVLVDFGGGLGGTWVNHQALFRPANQYIVVEQVGFVKAGRALADERGLPVSFLESLDELAVRPEIVLLSGVLSYLPNFEHVLKEITDLMPDLIIIDRQAIAPQQDASSSWWLQREESYYGKPLSYPIQLIKQNQLMQWLRGYDCIESWRNEFDAVIPEHHGFLFAKKSIL